MIANDPEAPLVVTKPVDKSNSQQNGVLTYTYKISNTGGSSINTTFQDLLPGELTFVGGSLSGLSGSYISSTAVTPYSGSAVLSMRDLSIPASSTLTFTIQANVNSYTIGQVATNIAMVSPDINSGYRIRTFTSNGASTTITSNSPDLSPTLILPDASFPNTPGAYKDFVANIQEVAGSSTSGSGVTITVTAPAGYTLAFDTGATSVSVSGGSTTTVNNNDWQVSNNLDNRQLTLTVKPSITISGNGQSVIAFRIVRTTASPSSISNITVSVTNDTSGNYDNNSANNVYARIISGL